MDVTYLLVRHYLNNLKLLTKISQSIEYLRHTHTHRHHELLPLLSIVRGLRDRKRFFKDNTFAMLKLLEELARLVDLDKVLSLQLLPGCDLNLKYTLR